MDWKKVLKLGKTGFLIEKNDSSGVGMLKNLLLKLKQINYK